MALLDEYAYTLPPELVAQTPVEPRDSARLFVYDTSTDTVQLSTFSELGAYLPTKALLVCNDTQVVPARLRAETADGKPIELFLLMNDSNTPRGEVRALVDRRILVGDRVRVGPYEFVATDNRDKWMTLTPQFPLTLLPDLLQVDGTTPIPPYIKDSTLSEAQLRKRYQSVFARRPASVAAPTASLHFTERLLGELTASGFELEYVTLHVGLGTFAPVLPEQMEARKLHEEWYEVGDAVARHLRGAHEEKRPIVAVGTTVVRTLESARRSVLAGRGDVGTTELFIAPPYDFIFPDALITNFHVPRSSLMCLVDAFLAHKQAKRRILELYERAIREQFRFYSFGDGMLIK